MNILKFLIFKFSKVKIHLIEKDHELEKFIHKISNEKHIAVDTEFIWRNTYYPRLSLIQICTKKEIYIFDCIMLKELTPIKEIFENNKIMKIFHSIRGDTSVIHNCLNAKINNIFDTQLAENLITNHNQQISYKSLVQKYFYINLPKTETNSNWEVRPLTSDQLIYASEDVRYLISIMKMQCKYLSKNRLTEKFKSLCLSEKKLGETDPSLTRLSRLRKKKNNLSKMEESFFIWREEEAKRLDVPPNKIFKEKNLKKLKMVMDEKKYSECKWIIKDQNSRKIFLERFE